MRYMLLICTEGSVKPNPKVDLATATDAWVEEMDGRGVRQSGGPLRPSSDATTVRLREGEVVLTDGPFAETKEQIAGYDLIECADLDEAIEVASKHPMAEIGMIEVRPMWEE